LRPLLESENWQTAFFFAKDDRAGTDIAMRKAIFFDAAGTLIRLKKSVGWNYALVAQRQGLELEAGALDRAFAQVWKEMPLRPATGQPRPDDDKAWWRDLVERVLDRVSTEIDPLDRDTFFETAYGRFAEAGVWKLYPEVPEVLEILAHRFELAVVSNFDGRLRLILNHLGVAKYFRHIFLSSELGADKPDSLIYQRSLELSGFSSKEVLHAGDDPKRDWDGASRAGLGIFRLQRPHNSLRDLLPLVASGSELS
jgi:putative hydrolase of the HAD superfamily